MCSSSTRSRNELLRTVYARVTSAAVVEERPVFVDALIAMNRHAAVPGAARCCDGLGVTYNARIPAGMPGYRSVVIVLEHPVALCFGMYIALGTFSEATAAYCIQ